MTAKVQLRHLLRLVPTVILAASLVACESRSPSFQLWLQPSADPDRVVLTWSGDPATTQSVTWRTDSSVDRAYVELGRALPEPNLGFQTDMVDAVTLSVDLEIADTSDFRDGDVRYHAAELTGLEPHSQYVYRVGDGTRWSEWFQFRTASSERQPFRFLYMGDVQNGILSHWARTIRSAVATAPDARFVIYAGDLVNRGHSDREWGEWFKAADRLHAELSSIPVTGNHEYAPLQDRQPPDSLSVQWRPQFTLPVEPELSSELAETVFSLEYQGVRILVLNSNLALQEQAEWLRQELRNSNASWHIAVFHHPIFASRDATDPGETRDAWLAVFKEYGVDLVLQGHDHNYARGHISNERSPSDASLSTVFVTSVAGPKMYAQRPGGWDEYSESGVVLDRTAENTQFFNVVEASESILSFKAYTVTGDLYDAFELRRNSSGGTELIESDVDVPVRIFDNTIPYIDRWTGRRAERIP